MRWSVASTKSVSTVRVFRIYWRTPFNCVIFIYVSSFKTYGIPFRSIFHLNVVNHTFRHIKETDRERSSMHPVGRNRSAET